MSEINLIYVFLNIIALSEYYKTLASRVFDENGVETILAHEFENVNIQCSSDLPMAYCGFVHPGGHRYSFSGRDTNVGKCAIKINATKDHAGTWRCHIGTQHAGVETMKVIQLRIVGEVAAVEKNITTTHGKSKTLYCATTKGFIPLSYCRFEPPNALPFSIDSSVTEAKPLLKRYYFPNNKSLDRGDCAVTIRKVKYEDVGAWTCGVGYNDGKEYIDVINIDVEGASSYNTELFAEPNYLNRNRYVLSGPVSKCIYTMSTASATGITFGAFAIFALLSILGFVAWKKRSMLGSRPPEATREAHELAQMTGSPHLTPQPERSFPLVTVESPSEQSDPGTTSPLVQSEQA